ncbi:TlpA family protein disulfide reductase [Algoriphagus machipongonensis]|uniref:Antioxidant, AhpC/TSA family n=1 Tax=Algoriphagus machipongonensis TaxID=388413 RepID=A3HXM8_9BACT|nr:redoxin domain-containing protein [Algoriphagus machipongonensis]EAZ81351.1 antioxidant, AhpC/TSA family [Algoriphagus machipongonensis]
MKKSNLIILITLLLGSTAYLGYSFQPEKMEEVTKVRTPKLLPDYNLYDINGKVSSIHQLAGDKPTLFIYFNSTCHLCQDELGEISKRIDEFKDYNLIFTTVQPKSEMINFVNELEIKDRSNVHFLLDADMNVASYLQIRSVPSIFCYNTKKELMTEYVGITKIDLLLENLARGI